jgi:Rap1a immunity proteins
VKGGSVYFFAMVACMPVLALAQDGIGKEDGAQLLARCELAMRILEQRSATELSRDEYGNAMSCLGFVDGFIWGHGWAAWRQNSPMYYCPPDRFSASEGVPALVQYLRAHPERLDSEAHILTFAALSSAYPCEPVLQSR